MTKLLYLDDAYLRTAEGVVSHHTPEGGIVLDTSLFYPTGGGQPGDSGRLDWDDHALEIATAIKGPVGASVLVPAEPRPLPPIGKKVTQVLDWERRHKHMRVHTALHLLSVVLPFGVIGGQIAVQHGRLDFHMPEMSQTKEELEQALNAFVAQDLRVYLGWITTQELDANPQLVKTMAVKPPRSTDKIRLVRIGDEEDWIDLQPCGGTHVARTGEIGSLRVGRIENKGRSKRRVYVHLDS